MRTLAAAVACAAALGLSGCVGYEVKPAKPVDYPKAEAPAPLKVGVLVKTAPFEWIGMGMSASRMDGYRSWSRMKPMFEQVDAIGGKFVEALSGARAFAQVDAVRSMGFFGSDAGGHDLFIDAQFSGRYTQDPAQFGKAFISGFLMFLPVPFVRYEDSYRVSADLSVYDGEGRLVHKYSEQQDAGTEAALFSAGMPDTIAAGVESASTNLAAKLVAEIVADREGFVRASKTAGSDIRPRPAAPSAAAAAPAPTAAPSSLDDDAPPPARHAPRPELTADDAAAELLP